MITDSEKHYAIQCQVKWEGTGERTGGKGKVEARLANFRCGLLQPSREPIHFP